MDVRSANCHWNNDQLAALMVTQTSRLVLRQLFVVVRWILWRVERCICHAFTEHRDHTQPDTFTIMNRNEISMVRSVVVKLLWSKLFHFRGVSSCSSLGWPVGWPHLYLGADGARIPGDVMRNWVSGVIWHLLRDATLWIQLLCNLATVPPLL